MLSSRLAHCIFTRDFSLLSSFFLSIRRVHTICSLVWVSYFFFFFSSRRRHTRCSRDWSSDVCSSDLDAKQLVVVAHVEARAVIAHAVNQVGAAALAGDLYPGRGLAGAVLQRVGQQEIGRASCRERV